MYVCLYTWTNNNKVLSRYIILYNIILYIYIYIYILCIHTVYMHNLVLKKVGFHPYYSSAGKERSIVWGTHDFQWYSHESSIQNHHFPGERHLGLISAVSRAWANIFFVVDFNTEQENYTPVGTIIVRPGNKSLKPPESHWPTKLDGEISVKDWTRSTCCSPVSHILFRDTTDLVYWYTSLEMDEYIETTLVDECSVLGTIKPWYCQSF